MTPTKKPDEASPREEAGEADGAITDRRLLAAQLLRSQKLDSLGMFAKGIAHDLNNVLQPVVMAIDLLKNSTDLEQVREVCETLDAAATRGERVVRQVTMFSRGADGKKAPIHPRFIAKDLTRTVYDTFPKNVGFRMSVASDVAMIVADPTQMHQALLNLCVNARDSMPDGGELTLGVKNAELDGQFSTMVREFNPGGYVAFSVSDTGAGIPPELHNTVFEPFFTTKATGGGVGLGLSTVMLIARGHGGFVTLDSQVSRGSTFNIYIPRQSY